MARPGQQIWASWWENRSKKLDWKILAFSLLAACGLWFMGHLARASEFTLSYALIPKSSTKCDYIGESAIPIKVIVKAKGFDLGDRWFQKDHTTIPLPTESFNCDGETQLIESQRIYSLIIPTLNEGLQLKEIVPNQIPILLSKQVQKKLPVQVKAIAKAKIGYVFSGKYEVVPNEIPVEGDQTLVASLNVLQTKEIELGHEPVNVLLDVPDDLEVGQKTVQITAIMDTIVSKSFDIKPVWNESFVSKELYLSDDLIQVTIIAKAQDLRSLQPNQIKVLAKPSASGIATLETQISGIEPEEVILDKATVNFVAI